MTSTNSGGRVGVGVSVGSGVDVARGGVGFAGFVGDGGTVGAGVWVDGAAWGLQAARTKAMARSAGTVWHCHAAPRFSFFGGSAAEPGKIVSFIICPMVVKNRAICYNCGGSYQ